MIRHNVRLYREGRWTGDGRMLVDTCLPAGPIPLQSNKGLFGHDMTHIRGTVTDVRRGRRGWVLGTLTSDSAPAGDWFDFTGLACEADFDAGLPVETFDGKVKYHGSILRSVVVGSHPCWKGMTIR